MLFSSNLYLSFSIVGNLPQLWSFFTAINKSKAKVNTGITVWVRRSIKAADSKLVRGARAIGIPYIVIVKTKQDKTLLSDVHDLFMVIINGPIILLAIFWDTLYVLAHSCAIFVVKYSTGWGPSLGGCESFWKVLWTGMTNWAIFSAQNPFPSYLSNHNFFDQFCSCFSAKIAIF